MPTYNKRKADDLKEESHHLEEVNVTSENGDKTASQKTRKEKNSKLSKTEKKRKFGNDKKTSKENNDNIDNGDEIINLEDIDDLMDEEAKKRKPKLLTRDEEPKIPNLTYKLKNKAKEFQIKETDGKMKCPFCGISIKNIKIYFQRHGNCGAKIDMDQFIPIHTNFLLQKRRDQIRLAVEKQRIKKQADDPEKFESSS